MITERDLVNNKQDASIEAANLAAIVLKYLAYWPWILTSAIVCLVLAYVWLRFQTPVYNTTASVLIKENDKAKAAQQNSDYQALATIGMISMTTNFDNEVEILQSRTLVEKVVSDMGIYCHSYLKRKTGYNAPLYGAEPFKFFMDAETANELTSGIVIDSKYSAEDGLVSELTYFDAESKEEQKLTKTFKTFPATWATPLGMIQVTDSLFAVTKAASDEPVADFEMQTIIQTPLSRARGIVANLTVSFTSKTTTIAAIGLNTNSRKLGVDFISRLVEMYNADANNEKNEVARRTADFIEKRLQIINSELGETDDQMASFKQQSGLTDLSSDAQLALQQNSRYEELRTDNAMQISLVQFLRQYINDPKNFGEVIPANVGLTDANLTKAISDYNALIIERRKLQQTASDDNPAVRQLTVAVDASLKTVKTTVESVLKGLNITRENLDKEARRFASRISSAPQQEKQFLDISRQQNIKAALYTTLLSKREENAINLSSTANNCRIVERPLSGVSPVSPRRAMIMLIALILGLGLPIAFIYLRDMFKYKIETTEDVAKLTTVPCVAELPRSKSVVVENSSLVVRENKNNMMEEAFRNLRTNVLFMLEGGQNVIMVSSSIPSEGKSFVSSNLACSLAYLGKKVLIIGADIRKPGLNKAFGLPKSAKGITNYLSHPESADLMSLIYHSELSPNLDILFGGSIPPNPTELVSRPIFGETINKLKAQYDYVILDTAPIGMISDSNIISQHADVLLYICRLGSTPKAAFEYVNDLKEMEAVKKVCVVVNDVDLSDRRYGYGYGKYGYGKRYGYGYVYGKAYGYGYGYGYGYEQENKKEDEAGKA